MSTEVPFDFSTGQMGVVHQDKSVLHLSHWITRAYRAAVTSSRDFAVLSPPDAAITLPLDELLSRPGCQWVVATADGSFFDATTGQLLQWTNGGFESIGEPANEFLAAPAGQGHIRVQADTLHPASANTRVGRFCERIFTELTGAAPAGWGLVEPASELWDTAELNAYFRNRAPMPTTAVVIGAPRPGSGAPSIATLSMERSSRGVHEIVTFLAETPEPVSEGELEGFARAMHDARARHAVLGHGLGHTNLNRPARFTGATVPACALFGPETLETAGPRNALQLAGDTAQLVGAGPLTSLLITYSTEPTAGRPHPLAAYDELVAALTGASGESDGHNLNDR
ncbi:DUF6177 family protein [Arthrobacter castelli]|uniref:DUF6177 family protein n=1 Tax=Arthrobacter castelli TaxID=271431 RepID=UPI00041E033F|nr:DUF6177 family protein [Arthrobacter castelli]